MKEYWPPSKIILAFLIAYLAAAAAASYLGTFRPLFLLNESQLLYLLSTSAQVLAGVYGLTLAGFIFFRNELSREEREDETLVEAVESLKQRYFVLLLFATAFSMFTLLLSNLAISYLSVSGGTLKVVVINSAQSAFVLSLLIISHFIFEVISPKRVERASQSLQRQVDPRAPMHKRGSLEDFLTNYNKIESLLGEHGQKFQSYTSSSYESKPRRHISNTRLAEMLFRNEFIDESLYSDLKALITLRNSIIHGAEPIVSQKIVQTSSNILHKLRTALEGAEP